MSQTEKAAYYKALKSAGVSFDRHYRQYSTEELKAAYDHLYPETDVPVEAPVPEAPQAAPSAPPAAAQEGPGPIPQAPADEAPEVDPEAAAFYGIPTPQAVAPVRTSGVAPRVAPRAAKDPAEMAGQRLNSKDIDEPIRTDELGRVWFQEEVLKPAYPKPRGRRVLTYMDSGAVQKTVKNGDYMESFEVSGDPANARPAEVKITLPSYQVGIFQDPRFPFRTFTYNGVEGFDLFQVQEYYGGAELVPAEIKRVYVENVLCYDIRTTVRAIESEYRQQQLAGLHR